MLVYPFTAIVGQDEMKLALLLNAVDPLIGGVLIQGRRGTAKSTAVRALAALLPPLRGVADCPFFCPPDQPAAQCAACHERLQSREAAPIEPRPMRVVNLPLNASEDRVAGGFDLERTLATGHRYFEPGLLAEANRHVLYIDEVNLLGDHIIDLLLDAAAMGVNVVEREGIHFAHPSRFILVGTMNPEEGELRSQLLDRFGLSVKVTDVKDADRRVAIVQRRAAFEADPAGYVAAHAGEERGLAERILAARALLPRVRILDGLRQTIAEWVGVQLKGDGHRGDLTVSRTAKALAALGGRDLVTLDDVRMAVRLAMAHRVKALNLTELPAGQHMTSTSQEGQNVEEPTEVSKVEQLEEPDDLENESPPGMAGVTRRIKQGEEGFPLNRIIRLARDYRVRNESGKRYLSRTDRKSGRYVRSLLRTPVTDLAFDATLRAAAPYQQRRGREPGGRLELRVPDFRQKQRERKTRALLVFTLDASDTVMSRATMLATKRAVLALLQDAYVKRDRVAMITFRFADARLVLPPTANLTQARRAVEDLFVGGCTPIATGLLESLRLIETERLRDPATTPVLILLTDGDPNVGLGGVMSGNRPVEDAFRVAELIRDRKVDAVVIDTGPNFDPARRREQFDPAKADLCPELARRMDAQYYVLAELGKGAILEAGGPIEASA